MTGPCKSALVRKIATMRNRPIWITSFVAVVAVLAAAFWLMGDRQRINHPDSSGVYSDTNGVVKEKEQQLDKPNDYAVEQPLRVQSSPSSISPNSVDPEIFWDVAPEEIDRPSLEEFLLSRHIEWYRIVNVNTDVLRAYIRNHDQTPEFQITLIGDHAETVVVRKAEEHYEGWRAGHASWQGQLADDPASNVSFFVQPDGSLNGVINSGRTGRIKIESIAGTPHHILWNMQPNVEVEID